MKQSKRSWEHLPLPPPSKFDPSESDPTYFYDNFVKPLSKDFIRIMNNGLLLDRTKVEALKKVVVDVVDNVHKSLSANPIIQDFQKYLYPIKYEEFKKEALASIRTIDYFLRPFKESDVIHRTYVVNLYLESIGKQKFIRDKWVLKDVKNLNKFLKDPFIDRVITKSLTESDTALAMQKLAADKRELWNRPRIDKVANATPDSILPKFNPGSSKQLAELFEFLDIEPFSLTKKGAPQWNRENIETLLKSTPPGDLTNMLQAFIDYSFSNIIKTNFMEAFEKFSIDNYLHGNIRNFGAKTYRP